MADFNSKYTGEQVEALLDIVSQGGGGEGGGGTITEAEITAMGFTKNLGTITEVKMNGASKGTSGVVDLGTVLTEHQDISGKADKSSLATVATSGSYNDLSNKPTIPSEVTESTVSGWGFTKNTGQAPYVLPFDIETLDGLSYSDNEGRLQTDADVFEKTKSAIEMGRMVVIRYGLSDTGYHICDATYNGDAISVRVYNGLMLYSFEIYASSQGSILVEQYSLQSELVDGVNIATINGQSLTAGGDITIKGGSTDGFVTKETIGVLTVANVQALYDGNDVYALPSSANGDEDDIIATESYVDNAIASAITNTINASY